MVDLQLRSLKFLLVEDDEEGCAFVRHHCEEAFGRNCHIHWVMHSEDAIQELKEGDYDIVLFDDRSGKLQILDFLEHTHDIYAPAPPTILLTSENDFSIDREVMNAGVADCLMRQELTARVLERSVRYALQHKRDQDHLARLAHYDSLTGLANRSLFYTKLEECIRYVDRSGKLLALFLLDLDNFKDINDTQGHPVGDNLLLKASVRIRQAMRETDIVARLGGDEFAVVASNIDNIGDVGKLANNLISSLNDNFVLDKEKVSVTASMGVSVYPADSTSVDELLKQCDMALYDAKARGRNTYSFFDRNLDRAIHRRQQIQADMTDALINNHFVLHYQPIIDSGTGGVVSVEALIRWNHPENGLISPDEFIPVAETTGFIVPLGEWVIKEVCRQKSLWEKEGMDSFSVAINLAANQFSSDKLVHLLNQTLKQYGLRTDSISLEITESTLMENTEDLGVRINKLHGMGYSFSLDDFGTGYSSLAYLKRFPVDKIKIDRSMVVDVPKNKENSAICEAIISIGKAFGIKVIAEGVETETQLNYFREIGCHQIQGYLISRPLEADGLAVWLHQHELKLYSRPMKYRSDLTQ